jgi:hypothetical protein
MTKPDMTTVDELAAAVETAGPDALPIDVLSDWYEKLIEARAAKESAAAEEKEANSYIRGYLSEHGASIGLIDGQPVIEMSTKSRRSAPALAEFDTITVHLADAVAGLFEGLLVKLGVPALGSTSKISTAMRKPIRAVLDSFVKSGEVTTLETKKFLPKS